MPAISLLQLMGIQGTERGNEGLLTVIVKRFFIRMKWLKQS